MEQASRGSRKDDRLRKPARRGDKTLRGVISYEPNRLSDECLASAYELALPLVQPVLTRRRTKRNESDELNNSVSERTVI